MLKIGIDARELKEKRVGIGTYIYQIIKILNEKDKKNEYFLYSNQDIYLDFKLNDNWHIVKKKCKIGSRFIYFKLPKILKKDGIEVFWGTEHCLPKKNKQTKKIKFILTIHDLAIQKFKKVGSINNTFIQRLILKKSCNNADKIIAISEATKKDLIEILNVKEKKIKVIYEGTNEKKDVKLTEEEEKNIVEKYNIKKAKFIFFLSTIEPRKNLNTAIRAFEKYREQSNDDLKFVVSGRNWLEM